MRPAVTPNCNAVLKSPVEGVADLPCEWLGRNVVMSTWDLTPAERLAIAEGAMVELYVMAPAHPAVALEVSKEPRELPPQFPAEQPA